ncbi:MAG TPA: hypothetical protein VEB86_06205 [Chryseosolibacter sp.]|nr:hypothetical protein [Chryseosolibacter sp.]
MTKSLYTQWQALFPALGAKFYSGVVIMNDDHFTGVSALNGIERR